MEKMEISFDNLPRAVAELINEVKAIKLLVEKEKSLRIEKSRTPIGIEEASKIIGKAKPTIYTLVQKRLLPCYKNGKKLYFFEEELLEWIESGKKKTIREISAESSAFVFRDKNNNHFKK